MAFIGAVMLLVAIPATAIGYRLAVADRSIGGGASPAVIDAERTVLIDGEKIAVTDVVYRADEDMLDIVVVNQERLDRASVLFVAMDEGTVTISDGTGRGYEVLHASTGLRRDDSGAVAAGDSTFTVSGPFDPNLDQLTLTVMHSSKLVPSTAGVEIQLP
jgi:hypothetical protein